MVKLFCIVVCGSLLTGCALVKPLEREYLGDPILRMPENELENRLDHHRFPRREGSMGAGTGAGAGCGC